jgi:hypothetical protein
MMISKSQEKAVVCASSISSEHTPKQNKLIAYPSQLACEEYFFSIVIEGNC